MVNQAGVPQQDLARFENAAQKAINGDFRAAWKSPRIDFGPGGSGQLRIVDTDRAIQIDCQVGSGQAYGCHRPWREGTYAVVDVHSAAGWQYTASHELEEMLVNPKLDGHGNSGRWVPFVGDPRVEWTEEVADPVQDWYITIDGVHISDFVYPAWFANTPGRQDERADSPIAVAAIMRCHQGEENFLVNATQHYGYGDCWRL